MFRSLSTRVQIVVGAPVIALTLLTPLGLGSAAAAASETGQSSADSTQTTIFDQWTAGGTFEGSCPIGTYLKVRNADGSKNDPVIVQKHSAFTVVWLVTTTPVVVHDRRAASGASVALTTPQGIGNMGDTVKIQLDCTSRVKLFDLGSASR